MKKKKINPEKLKSFIELYNYLSTQVKTLDDAKKFAKEWAYCHKRGFETGCPVDCTIRAMAEHLSRIVEGKGAPKYIEDRLETQKYYYKILEYM